MRLKKGMLVAMLVTASASLFADACATTTSPITQLAKSAGPVALDTGITAKQANSIASYYYRSHISGCGFADAAVDRGSRWEVTPRLGIGGVPSADPIVIEKHTGLVFRRNGPSFKLQDLIASAQEVPTPIRKGGIVWPKRLPHSAHGTLIEIAFVVLPSGRTSFTRIRSSSGRFECDRAALNAVEAWQYPPRKQSIELIERFETCTY